jgi:arabinosaccharide transport system substrate-binding protein
MKRFTSLLLGFLALVMVMALLPGCQKKQQAESSRNLEMWTFVDLHATFYNNMLQQWNKDHPDKALNITFTNMPYGEMHDKVMMAVQTGKGMPDLVDIEIGQFPNFMKGNIAFLELNDYIAPYANDLVKARIDIYSKDGKNYGFPTHVGATVMYYNAELLDAAGIDYKTIVTWDDFTAAARKYKAATGKVITSVDTGGTDWLWLAMAEHGEDWTNAAGRANIKLDSVRKMLALQQGWLREGIAITSPGGHIDQEAGFQNLISGNVVAFPKAMWYMSRFVNYMPELKGKIAIAPCPVFTRGQPRSVGIGGTGTVVAKSSPNAALAAEYMAWAKLSLTGNIEIWNELGFDTCNTSVWTDPKVTQDTSNKFIAYFKTNPFDTLNQIRNEIGMIRVQAMSPVINEQINLHVLEEVLVDGGNIETSLNSAQAQIDLEQ